MNIYLANPQLSGNLPKSILFDLAMGAGDMIIIISNKLSDSSLSMVEGIQCGGLTFVNTTPQILSLSEISTYLEYLYEFKEYNECTIPKDVMVFAVPAHKTTQDIASLFNGNYFRFFILDNVLPSTTILFDDYPYATILEY